MSAMLSLSGYDGTVISPLCKEFLILKSANHLPFSNAQKQCRVQIYSTKNFLKLNQVQKEKNE